MRASDHIRTPDQRLRVFISSTLVELAAARAAVRRAVEQLRLTPIMFELGARPYPPQALYRAYLAQSDIFVGIYGESYGWVAPGEEVSGLEDELLLSEGMPRLLYVQRPAPDREPRLEAMLDRIRESGSASYRAFGNPDELQELVVDDLAVLLSERFEGAVAPAAEAADERDARHVILHPANPLIGREDEVATLLQWLDTGATRLITLTGPGGVGKSRIALEVATLLTGAYPDGVFTVLLEAVNDATLVLPTIARTLQVRTSGSDDVVAAMAQQLHDRRLLLVIDNFEHLLDAAPDLARVLESCPGVQVLVTSRAPLRIRAERELPVAPLTVPDDPASDPLGRLEESAAVRLFLARAKAAHYTFDPGEEDLRAIGELSRKLDGLPLAIELAAARVRLLPPRQLLRRLDHRFRVLSGGTTDMPERHHTLRSTVDWGYDLLEQPEQVALRRVGVFAGGWTLGAAEAVLGAAGPLQRDILDVLDALVSSSFVVPPRGGGAAPRFSMLETIREYAREKLLDSDDLDATVDAHADYFLEFAEQAAPELHGPDQTLWFDALEEDHDNLLAALRRLAERGDIERQLRLTAALGRLWFVHAHVREATQWMGVADAASAGRRDTVRAGLLTWIGWVDLFVHHDIDRAEAAGREALEIRRELGDRHGEVMEILSLGNVAAFRGDAPEAARLYRQTAELGEAEGHGELHARGLSNLGVVERALGHLDEAERALMEGGRLMAARGDHHAVALTVVNLAGVMLDRGNTARAEQLGREAVERAISVGDDSMVTEAAETLAAVWAEQGRLLAAAWVFGAAEALAPGLAATRSTIEQPLYDRYVARARERARDAGVKNDFDAAWRAGAGASRDELVAVALGKADAPVDNTRLPGRSDGMAV